MATPQRETRSLTVIVIVIVATLGVGGYITCKASQEAGRTEGTGVDGPGTTPSKR